MRLLGRSVLNRKDYKPGLGCFTRSMECDKTTCDAKQHTGPFKLLKVEVDGLRVARCEGCGSTVTRRPKMPPLTHPDLELVERSNDRTTRLNIDQTVWENAAKIYRARQDGGPTFHVLEGYV